MKRAKKALGEAISEAVPWNGDGVIDAVPLPVPFMAPELEADALAPYDVIVNVSPIVIDDVIVAAPDPAADKAEADIGMKIPEGTILSVAADNGLIAVLDGVKNEDPLVNDVGVILGLLVDAPSTIADWLGEECEVEAIVASSGAPESAFWSVLVTCGLNTDALLAGTDEDKDEIEEEIDATGAIHFVHTVEIDVLKIVDTLVVTCRVGVPLRGVMVFVTGQVVRVV